MKKLTIKEIKALTNAELITSLENACFEECNKPTIKSAETLKRLEIECAARFGFELNDIHN